MNVRGLISGSKTIIFVRRKEGWGRVSKREEQERESVWESTGI